MQTLFRQSICSFAVLLLILADGCSHAGKKQEATQVGCSSTREYVTTLTYLRENSGLAGREAEARSVADEVSKGCTGAAKRFINTANLLKGVEVDHPLILNLAIELAKSDDAVASAFHTIFQKVYLKSYLDLDLGTALKISKALSVDFKGDAANAEHDFSRLVKFCMSETSLQLSQAKCAEFASRIANSGSATRGEVFSDFESIYRFLSTQKDVRLSVQDAAATAESVVKIGREAPDNFRQAFLYAKSPQGLSLGPAASVKFALEMAGRTVHQ